MKWDRANHAFWSEFVCFQYTWTETQYWNINTVLQLFWTVLLATGCDQHHPWRHKESVSPSWGRGTKSYHTPRSIYINSWMYHLKHKQQSRTTAQKRNQNQVHPRVIDSPNLPRDTRDKVTRLLGRCSRQLCKSCAGANIVYSRAELVFILEHYLASKSFAAVREVFNNAYPDKEVPNKTTIHRLLYWCHQSL
jgi:hypothetical protein